jgi:hypothetical protein
MLCRSRSLHVQGPLGEAARCLKCRSWTCTWCFPDRRSQLIAIAIAGNPERFVTITWNHRQNLTPELAAAKLADAWRKTVRQIRKLNPHKDLQYLCVVERTKLGWPHLHILTRGPWIPQRWLSEQLRALAGSPIVDIRRISSSNAAARYVAKYCGKEPARIGTTKRYWMSKNYCAKSDTDAASTWRQSTAWVVSDWSLNDWVTMWENTGRAVQIKDLDCAYWGAPPWNTS